MAGTPNKATGSFKACLQEVFGTVWADPVFRHTLARKVRRWELDPRVLQLLLSYAYGAPPREFEGQPQAISLAQLVSGSALLLEAPAEDAPDERPS